MGRREWIARREREVERLKDRRDEEGDKEVKREEGSPYG